MKIKQFCEGYNKIVTDKLRQEYLTTNLVINTYIPYITKITIADKLANISMVDEKTGNVKFMSDLNYLLFCRAIVENYTNLDVETEGFYEEYDELAKSGLLYIITSAIPENELKEFKMICDFKKNDLIQNRYKPHTYIDEQISKFIEFGKAFITPLINNISDKINEIDNEELKDLLTAINNSYSSNE